MTKSNCIDVRKQQVRKAFGAFTTGVTVVTAKTADGNPIGFTANSFTSVSLDPALLLVCISKASSNHKIFTDADCFAINVLGEEQTEISTRFASRVIERFTNIKWYLSGCDVPHIEGTVAWFDCSRHGLVDAGDHTILIGRVEEFGQNDKRPLAYLRGHYLDLGLAEIAVDSAPHHGGVRVGCVLENMGKVLLRITPNGWSLPIGDLKAGFRKGRISLDTNLAARGIKATMGFLYSVFEAPSGNATWMIFQGEMEQGPLPKEYGVFPIDSLPIDEIAVPEVRSILRRFQSEFKESRFGLYVGGSLSSGQINSIDNESTNWTNYVDEINL